MLEHDLSFAAIVCGCVFGGSLLGMWVRVQLPQNHLDKPTEDAVRVAMGTLATLTALVIGLLVASARSSFDTCASELTQMSGDLILLDRQLVHYGPDAAEARQILHRYALQGARTTWPEEFGRAEEPEAWLLLEDVQDRIRAFDPRDDARRWLRGRALEVSGVVARTRWLLDVQRARHPPAVPRHPRALVDGPLHELRPLRPAERHRGRRDAHVRNLDRGRDLPDPRNGQTLHGRDPHSERADSRDPRAHGRPGEHPVTPGGAVTRHA